MRALSGERVLFFPGMDGTGISYKPLSRFIAMDADVTVVRYPTDEILSFRKTVECAARQVGSANGAVVIAESFSGPVAVELVGSGRLKPKCLVLCATFARSPRPLMLGLGRCLPLAAILGFPIPEIILSLVLGGAEFTPSLLPMWQSMRDMVSPEVLVHRLNVVSRVDVRGRFPALTMPCCYLQATGDVVVPPRAARDFAAGVAGMEIKIMRGPHFLLQARPKEAATVIEEFKDFAGKQKQTDKTAKNG